jgi:hypothetical protein
MGNVFGSSPHDVLVDLQDLLGFYLGIFMQTLDLGQVIVTLWCLWTHNFYGWSLVRFQSLSLFFVSC